MCLHRADWLGKQADRITCRSIDFSSSFFFKKTGQHQSERHKTEGNGALGVLKPDLIIFFLLRHRIYPTGKIADHVHNVLQCDNHIVLKRNIRPLRIAVVLEK